MVSAFFLRLLSSAMLGIIAGVVSGLVLVAPGKLK